MHKINMATGAGGGKERPPMLPASKPVPVKKPKK